MGQSVRGSNPKFDFNGELLNYFFAYPSLTPKEWRTGTPQIIAYQDPTGKLRIVSERSLELINTLLVLEEEDESGEKLFSAYSGLRALLGTYLDKELPFPLFPKFFS